MEKYGFVYLWYDRKHKRYYIGAHWGTEDDGYVCSSKWMMRAYNIRPDDFKKRNGSPNRKILERIYTSKKDTFLVEHKWLQLIKKEELRIRYYNLIRTGSSYWRNDGKTFNDEHKRKMSESQKGRQVKEETRGKISASLKSYYASNTEWESTKVKRAEIMSEKMKGRIFSEEHKKKLSEAATARPPLSEEIRQKISQTKCKAPAKRIYFDKKRNKYLVQYQHKTVGRFPTEEAAEIALNNYIQGILL